MLGIWTPVGSSGPVNFHTKKRNSIMHNVVNTYGMRNLNKTIKVHKSRHNHKAAAEIHTFVYPQMQ